MKPPHAIDEVIAQLRTLRLPYMRKAAPELLKTARSQRWDPAEALTALLAEEIEGRSRSSQAMRLKAANLPSGKTFASWDEQLSSIPSPTQRSLKTLEWIERRENVVACGPAGTGKSHFLEALCHLAIERGYRASWFSLEELGRLIRRSRADDSAARAVQRVLKADLIVGWRHRSFTDRRGDGGGVLPGHRRRLREKVDRPVLEHAPLALRRDHARLAGQCGGGPAAAPHPSGGYPGRQHPPDPGPGRRGGQAAEVSKYAGRGATIPSASPRRPRILRTDRAAAAIAGASAGRACMRPTVRSSREVKITANREATLPPEGRFERRRGGRRIWKVRAVWELQTRLYAGVQSCLPRPCESNFRRCAGLNRRRQQRPAPPDHLGSAGARTAPTARPGPGLKLRAEHGIRCLPQTGRAPDTGDSDAI